LLIPDLPLARKLSPFLCLRENTRNFTQVLPGMFSFFWAQTNGMIFDVLPAVLKGIQVFWDLMMCP
jgi:hypothetical protein